MCFRVRFHCADVLPGGVRFVLLRNRRQIALAHVAGEERRLRREQEEFTRRNFFLVRQLERDGRFSGIEMREQLFDHGGFRLRGFRSGAHFLLQAVTPFLQGGEIGQDELGVDHLDVAHRIDRATDVMDVAALETPHDLNDRVHFADVAEELVAEAFARARPFHQSGDVDELDRGRDDFLGMRKLGERFESVVGHGDDAEVRVDRAERIIGRLRFSRARDGVEKGRFANVRQTHDSGAQHRRAG